MPNEHRDGMAGDGDGGAGGDSPPSRYKEVTKRTDYPRLFAINLGLALRASGRRVVENGDAVTELGGKLSPDSPMRRRAGLAGLDVELATTVRVLTELLVTVDEARTIIQEQAIAIQLENRR